MKIVLLNPPGKKKYARDKYCNSISKGNYYWHPCDLLILSGRLRGAHEILVIDAIALGLSPEAVMAKLRIFAPEAVIFLTSSGSWQEDFALMAEIKRELKTINIGIGGNLLHTSTTVLTNHRFIDAVLRDFTSASILDYLDRKPGMMAPGGAASGPAGLPDIDYRNGDQIISGGFSPDKYVSYPSPDHARFPLDRYSLPWINGRFMSVMTSFGCPFHCSFCLPATVPYRMRTIDSIREELTSINKLGIRNIHFHDPTFTVSVPRTLQICELLRSYGLSWSCLSRIDCVNAELLAAMKASGCHTIIYGVESGNDVTLERMRKGFTTRDVERIFKLTRDAGIKTSAFFILGYPGEDRAMINNTIQFAIRIDPDYVAFTFPMPHPGVAMTRECSAAGYDGSDRPAFDDLSGAVLETPGLSRTELEKFMRSAYLSFYMRPGYILSHIRDLRSLSDILRKFKSFTAILRNIFSFNRHD